jgi:hypothetical protein
MATPAAAARSAGSAARSRCLKPETRWLAAWLLEVRPVAVVRYHSRCGFVEGTLVLAQPYSRTSGYALASYPDALLGYRTAGTLAQWLTEHDIDTVLIELSNSTATEFERNRAGLEVLHQAVSAKVPPASTAPWELPTSRPFIR